ncbi:DUF4214 domain-containing protein [Halomonas sabkhae]|uniref:DUF4214 domain-containing protein n=1 Tax=Halomonas sabkhae TaxID=626223 RepID=UPI0025B33447|nr:DUF4214 domain-containing protein [Halomonas sabkhae]MDN3524358.1 DUF4214 domain-containing protein [Halomonas sabkhae]
MADDLKLKVTLTGDGRRLTGALDNAQSEVRQFGDMSDRQGQRASAAMDRTGESAETVSGHLREMNGVGQAVRSTLLGVGTALAGAFAAGSIRNQARVIADTHSLAEALDVSTGKLQAWQYAGEQVGLGADKMGDIFKDTSDKLGDFARTGAGEAVDLVEQMGLNIDKLVQRSPDQQLLKIGEALDGLTASERTFFLESLADEAVRLQPLLENNAAGLREYTAEARALGVAMDDGAIDSAVQANRAMLQLEGSINGLVNQLTAELGPGLASTVEDFTDWIERAGGAEAVLEDITDVASTLAVLLAGRYAGALATATAAKIAATQQAVAYQAALARMAGVSRGAAAAQMTMAGASRAAAGALALVGGPLGLLVGAGGLLYIFREELGLVDKAAQGATRALNANSQAIRSGGEAALNSSYEALTLSLEEVSLQAQEAMAQLVELEARERFYADSNKGVAESVRAAIAEQHDALAGLWERQVDLQQAIEENRQRREALTNADREGAAVLKTLDDWLFETAESTQQNADATSSAAESADTFTSDLESLREQLDPAYAASQRLAESTPLLDQGLASGALSLDEYLKLWDKAAERFSSAGDGAKDAANTVDDESDAMATTWERRLERMDDATVDMWRSFLDGSEDAFGSFKRLAINTLAEVIHQYTTRRITASIGANIGGGQGAQSGGMLSGSGGGMDMGTLAKAGKWGYNQLFGAGAGAVGASGTAAVGYGSGFGSQVATGGYGGGWAGSASGAASSGAGGFASSAGSMASSAASGLATAGAGMAGGWAGGEVAGAFTDKQANSNYGQMAGTAVGAYVGSVVPVIGTYIGSAIGGFLGGAADTLFGSYTPFEGRFGTTETLERSEGAGKDGVFEHQDNARFHGQSALGFTGFRDVGTKRLQRAGTGDKDWAEELTAASVEMDNLVATMASSEGELEGMRDAVQSMEISSSNAGEVIDFALKERALAALETVGRSFNDEITELPTEEFAAKMENMVGGFSVISNATEQLNLQFNATADNALVAAGNIAEMVGGSKSLQQLQSQFFQTYTSDVEKAANSYSDVYEALRGITDEIPTTKAQYRQLVEAQKLNTQAGQEAYAQLLQLAPAFAQVAGSVKDVVTSIYNDVLKRDPDEAGLNHYVEAIESGSMTVSDALNEIRSSSEAASVAANGAADSINDQADASRLADQRARMNIEILRLQGREEEALRREREHELASMDESLRPLKERMWALQDAADAEDEAKQKAEERAKALRDAEEELAGFATTIHSWIDQMESTDRGLASPGDQLAAASEAYREQLAAARSGDRDALGSITQYADRFIEAQKGWSGSGGETASVVDGIKSELAELPERLSAEEFLAQEFRSAITEDLPREIESAIFDTRYRIGSLIEFAANAQGLPADLRNILQTRAHQLSATIDYLVGSNELDPDHRRLALEASNSYVTWLDLVVREDLTAGNRRLALGSTNDYQTWLDLAVRSDELSPDNRKLALQSANDYAVYVSNVLEKDLAPGTRRLALQRGNDYAASIALTLSADISADNRRLALSAGNEYRAWLDLAVRSNISRDNRRLALNNGNTYQTWLDLAVRKDLSAGDRRMALSSANRYAVHVQNILKSDLSADNRRLALRSGNDYSVAVNAALNGGVSSSVRELVFSAGNAYTTVVDGVMARGFNRNVRKLALESGNQFTTSMRAYLRDGQLSRRERKLLDANAENIVRRLRVSGGLDLSQDEWAVINAAEGTKRLEVLANVAFKPAEMKALGSIEVNTRKVREFFERAGSPSWGLRVSMSRHQDVSAIRSIGYHTAKQFRGEFRGSGVGLPITIANAHNQGGIRAIAGVWKNEWKNRGVQGFARGGWTGPGGKYDEAGVVHANEFVVRSEVVRQPGVRDMLEALNRGGTPMPAPPTSAPAAPMPPSSLQRGSRDDALLREANALHREMTRLLEELRRYAQSDQAQRGEGFRRVERATERGNKMLSRLAADKRLEDART